MRNCFLGLDIGRGRWDAAWLVEEGGQREVGWASGREPNLLRECLFQWQQGPRWVGIDAPLGEPARGPWREVDEALRQRGFPCYPYTAPWMREVAEEGQRWAQELARRGWWVAEVYPYASRRRWGWDLPAPKRARRGREVLQSCLRGVLPLPAEPLLSHHILDAFLAALTVREWALCRAEVLSGGPFPLVLPLNPASEGASRGEAFNRSSPGG